MAVTDADTEAATVEDTEEKRPGDYQLPTLALLNPPKTVDPATYERTRAVRKTKYSGKNLS